jgi:hypothetical protein
MPACRAARATPLLGADAAPSHTRARRIRRKDGQSITVAFPKLDDSLINNQLVSLTLKVRACVHGCGWVVATPARSLATLLSCSVRSRACCPAESPHVCAAIASPRHTQFDGVLDNVSQDVVYETCVQEAVDSSLAGYNSTVFAYGQVRADQRACSSHGQASAQAAHHWPTVAAAAHCCHPTAVPEQQQTGAGKTFTMSGDARNNYAHRGIIPRALQHVFRAADLRSDRIYKVAVSYLEIHNETLRDLLAEDPAASTESLAIVDDAATTLVSACSGRGTPHAVGRHRGTSTHSCADASVRFCPSCRWPRAAVQGARPHKGARVLRGGCAAAVLPGRAGARHRCARAQRGQQPQPRAVHAAH